MKSNGVRQKDLMENIGVASQVFASWKYDNGKSYMNYIDIIADYLNVTPEYLIHGKRTDDVVYTVEDRELIKNFHRLSQAQKNYVSQLVI